MGDTEYLKNELLCFLQQKSCVLKFDDLVTVSVDFYTTDEIKGAVASVKDHVEQRLPAFQGADKERKMIAEMLKIILNPEVKLPTYVAVDITRLPPVDIQHLDLSALLRELSMLRAEVRSIGQLREEIHEMKSAMKAVQQQKQFATASIVPSVNTDGDREGTGAVDASESTSNSASFSAKAKALQTNGMKARARRKVAVGSSTTNKHVKSVETVRTVDLFVSRLHPQTARSELVDCVNSLKGDIKITDIKCTKLQSKYEHLYSSFHVAVSVSSTWFMSAINLFSSEVAWPEGVFVKRYYKPRNGDNNEQP